MDRRDPHTLVLVRFLQATYPFAAGEQVELPWRDAEGAIRQRIAELVEPRRVGNVETR